LYPITIQLILRERERERERERVVAQIPKRPALSPKEIFVFKSSH